MNEISFKKITQHTPAAAREGKKEEKWKILYGKSGKKEKIRKPQFFGNLDILVLLLFFPITLDNSKKKVMRRKFHSEEMKIHVRTFFVLFFFSHHAWNSLL